MTRCIFGVLIGTAMACVLLSEVKADDDEGRPQGEWFLASIEVRGKSLPPRMGKGGSIVFTKEGKLILKDPGKPDRIGTCRIDASKEPKQIDLIEAKDGKTGEAIQGIYEFDGEKLKMALSADGAKGKRPSDFKGDKVLIVYRKQQKS